MEDEFGLCEAFTSFKLSSNEIRLQSLPRSKYAYITLLFKAAIYPVETILRTNPQVRRKDVYRIFGDLKNFVDEYKEELIAVDAVSSNVFLVRYKDIVYRMTLRDNQLIYEKADSTRLEDNTYSQTFRLVQSNDRIDITPHCYSI